MPSMPSRPRSWSRTSSRSANAWPTPNASSRSQDDKEGDGADRHGEGRMGTGKGWVDLRWTEAEPEPRDARVFPGVYAPVMIWEDGQRVASRCVINAALRASPRNTLSGPYNARRDNMEGFWKDLFGLSHGIMVVNAFNGLDR